VLTRRSRWPWPIASPLDLLGESKKSNNVVALVAIGAVASACSSSVKVGPEAVAGLTPDGTVDMNQVQVAYIGNAGGGNGTLPYHSNSYPFTVGGLGVGGIGASTVDAAGEVYKLRNLSQFPNGSMEAFVAMAETIVPVVVAEFLLNEGNAA
jgi:hypothetical protein